MKHGKSSNLMDAFLEPPFAGVAAEASNTTRSGQLALPPSALITLFVTARRHSKGAIKDQDRRLPCQSHAPCPPILFALAVGDRRALILLQHRRGRVRRRQRTKGGRTEFPRQRPHEPFRDQHHAYVCFLSQSCGEFTPPASACISSSHV